MSNIEMAKEKPKKSTSNIIVILIKNGKLETYEFSTISLAKLFTKELHSKNYIIVIGNIATDGFDSL